MLMGDNKGEEGGGKGKDASLRTVRARLPYCAVLYCTVLYCDVVCRTGALFFRLVDLLCAVPSCCPGHDRVSHCGQRALVSHTRRPLLCCVARYVTVLISSFLVLLCHSFPISFLLLTHPHF